MIDDLSLAGRLSFRHREPSLPPLPPGEHELGLSKPRDAVLIVPEGLDPARPVPLAVLFHGAGGGVTRIRPILEEHAKRERFLLLMPQSYFETWDFVIAGHGPDRERLDLALTEVASRFTLDRRRILFSGFSDGASYALSMGLTNGKLVTHVFALSGGFMSVLKPQGEPKLFVVHGDDDKQCPVESGGRGKVAKLQAAGYDVTYIEFHGGHVPQPDINARLVQEFLATPRTD